MKINEHPDYALTKDDVRLVRDCIEGQAAVKRETTLYLKHPNMVDQQSTQQQRRYQAYIDGAEFDEYPSTTLSSMLGQMTTGEIEAELPDALMPMLEDMDGDGMGIDGAVEVIYSNLLQAKFHILLAEFKGLANVDAKSVSLADVKEQNPRAVMKMYNRESLIDWEFKRINGRMQLSMMVLVEESVERKEVFIRECVKTYLLCALDENGDYYQQKYIETSGESVADGDPVVIKDPSGAPLKWIPAEIVVDQEWPPGSLPRRPGYLYPTCMMALYRYRASADYKEALRYIQPTTFTKGWTDGDKDLFKELNGRDYIAFGAGVSNQVPNSVEVEVVGLGVQAEPFERYFDANDKRSRAVGAIINDPQAGEDATATKAVIDNKNSTAVMSMIVVNTEAAVKRIMLYCGMFQGLWSQDSIEENLEQINLVLPREFVVVAMPEGEVNATISAFNSGLISKKEAIRKLVAGGFTVSDAETIMDEIESEGVKPVKTLPIANQQ